jgi:hypothetical protein
MDRRGIFPDVLAYHIADAVRLAEKNGFFVRITETTPPRESGHGPLRVVRQRMQEETRLLELTVTAEDWGKEV